MKFQQRGLPLALIVTGLVWAVCLAASACPAQRHAFYLDGREWFGDYRVTRECAAARSSHCWRLFRQD